MYLSIIIPVYNSSLTLKKLYNKILSTLESKKFKYEIIFIDDCSNDESWKIITDICNIDKNVTGITLNKNYGQHNSTFCGIQNAKGKYVLTMDDDLQHPPSEILSLIDQIENGFDVVYGTSINLQHTKIRNFLSNLIKSIIKKFMDFSQAQNINSFRIFKRNILESYKNFENSKINIDVLLSWSTNNFSSINVLHNERSNGKSGYTISKLINHSLTLLTNFSNIPLKIASYLGFIFSMFGFIILLYVLITYLFFSYPVKGFPFIASIISIFSGVQLLTLGIFGEYLSTIHSKSISKPLYVVKNTIKK
jgi:glycosyltransferase involved in cell wall biosynthesis